MIYDFGVFQDELYRCTYPAPGSAALADKVLRLLHAQGIPVNVNTTRGFDHGAWVPLMPMYPEVDIPVIQLSVQPKMSPEHHLGLFVAMGSEGIGHMLHDGYTYGILSMAVCSRQ